MLNDLIVQVLNILLGGNLSVGPEEWRGSRADRVPARALVHPDDGEVSGIGSGDRRRGQLIIWGLGIREQRDRKLA